MSNFTSVIVDNLLQIPVVLLFIWLAYRCVAGGRQLPILGRGAVRVLRFIVLLVTLGLLAGCAAGDPLHPTAQNLASPPPVTDR
jgi:hypothetical protein